MRCVLLSFFFLPAMFPDGDGKRPSVVLKPSTPVIEHTRTIHDDDHYKFAAINFGPKGDRTPGLHVYSKKHKTWRQIVQISTDQAKLGRSPTFAEAQKSRFGGKLIPSVTWDFSVYKEADYVPMPLKTSGSICFPEKISYEPGSGCYILTLHENWGAQFETRLVIRKADLDQGFAASVEKNK